MTNIQPYFGDYLGYCGWPNPSTSDLESWKTLTNTATATSVVKVGLFGYDTSCILGLCATQDDYNSLCTALTGLGIDGWSMGTQVKVTAADDSDIWIIQNQLNGGDIQICPIKSGASLPQFQFAGGYSVVASTDRPDYSNAAIAESFGLQKYGFTQSDAFGIATADLAVDST